jgi:hypothetical protein
VVQESEACCGLALAGKYFSLSICLVQNQSVNFLVGHVTGLQLLISLYKVAADFTLSVMGLA